MTPPAIAPTGVEDAFAVGVGEASAELEFSVVLEGTMIPLSADELHWTPESELLILW